MGLDHPIMWCHPPAGHRPVLVHRAAATPSESYAEPEFRDPPRGGIRYAAGLEEADCTPTTNPDDPPPPTPTSTRSPWPRAPSRSASRSPRRAARPQRPAHLARRHCPLTDPSATPASRARSPSTTTTRTASRAWRSTRTSPPTAGSTSTTRRRWTPPPVTRPDGTADGLRAFDGHNQLSRFVLITTAPSTSPASRDQLEVGRPRPSAATPAATSTSTRRATSTCPPATTPTPSPPTRLHPDRRPPEPQPGLRRPPLVGQHQRPARQAPAHQGRSADGAYTSPTATSSRPAPEDPARDLRDGLPQPVPDRASTRRPAGLRRRLRPRRGAADPPRGPAGQVEFNVLRRPGNYGWPYCHR